MADLVTNYYWVFLAISVVLFGLTLMIRVKIAKTKRDKMIYGVYGSITGVFSIALVLYKFL